MHLAEKIDPNNPSQSFLNVKDKDKKFYAGKEKRPFGRFEHSKEVEAIIRDIRGVLCSTQNCIFSTSQQDTLKHLDGMYGDISPDSNPSKGIEVHRDTTKHVRNVILYIKDAKKYIWKAIVIGALGWVGYALWFAFKAEVIK